MEVNKIYQGSALEILQTFEDESIDCCITSPPYWGLRAYGTNPQIWDGDSNCEHIWETEETKRANQSGGKGNMQDGNKGSFTVAYHNRVSTSDTCLKCGAWRGELGLEPTFELYISHLMQIFNEVKRVLKKTGTCWVNLGDSYSAESTHSSKSGATMYDGISGSYGKDSGRIVRSEYGRFNSKNIKQKSLCCIPDRFKIAMVDSEDMDEYELREDLTEEERKYVLTELLNRGII